MLFSSSPFSHLLGRAQRILSSLIYPSIGWRIFSYCLTWIISFVLFHVLCFSKSSSSTSIFAAAYFFRNWIISQCHTFSAQGFLTISNLERDYGLSPCQLRQILFHYWLTVDKYSSGFVLRCLDQFIDWRIVLFAIQTRQIKEEVSHQGQQLSVYSQMLFLKSYSIALAGCVH
jgi:hypothetical protein